MNKTVFVSLMLSLSVCADAKTYSREALSKSVNELAKQLPMKVDGVTMLSSVVLLKNNNIQYRYTLDKEKVINLAAQQANISTKELKAKAINQYGSLDGLLKVWSETVLKQQFVNKNCTTPETRQWIENDVGLVHTIYDKKGIFFYETTINKETCSNH